MDQINAFLEQIKNSDNPMIYYIIAAVALLVLAIVLRSLIATLIIFSGIAVLVLVVLYATGHPLPKIDLDKMNLPDFSKLLPSSSSTEPSSPTAGKSPNISLPSIPGTTTSKDPLKDAIIKGREERNNRSLLPSF
jgi:hypothetical protein